MSRSRNSLTKSSDLLNDRVRGRRPGEGMRSTVVLTDELLNLGDEGFDRAEGSAPNCPLCDDIEPDFHLIEP